MSLYIKPNFSSITQTIATFLAPPPHPPPPVSADAYASSSSFDGLKNDLAEIGDTLKMGMIGITKFASNLIGIDQSSDLDQDNVVGVTDDVVQFVRAVSVRPECWIDFPLSLLHKDFRMSQVQKDHTVVIQDLVPTLATLRRTIHNFMNEQQFWMIYFILMVPRLNDNECHLLLTPEIRQMHEEAKGSMVNKAITDSSGEVEVDNTMKNKKREDDVCFTDVEDEEYKQTQSSRVSSASENSDWIRVSGTSKANRSRYRERRSESEGSSSDWQAVEDGDL